MAARICSNKNLAKLCRQPVKVWRSCQTVPSVFFGVQAAVWCAQEVRHHHSSELVGAYAATVDSVGQDLLCYTWPQNLSEFLPLFEVVTLVSQLLAW